jgi:predicted nucleic-acid-binding protein
MSARRLVDTNLIVRHLTQDHSPHAQIAGALFAACDRGELTLVVLPTVLAECVFVLESFYKHSRDRIAGALGGLIGSGGIEIENVLVYRDALRRYAHGKLHFVDYTIIAAATAGNMPIATLDEGIRKLGDVTVSLQ